MARKTVSNPFTVGSKVKLRDDVLQRHARSVPAHAGYTTEQFRWRDTLRAYKDVTGTVTRLFDGSKHVNVEFPNPVGSTSGTTTIGIDFTELVPA